MKPSKVLADTGKKKPPRAGMGRPKGSANKSTVAVKEALQMAFEGIGGVKTLIKWATDPDNQGEFFKLYAKLLPIDMKHSGEIRLPAIVELPPKDPRD